MSDVFGFVRFGGVFLAPSVLSAQSKDFPKVEVFGGYSWYHPGGGVSSLSSSDIPDFNKGWGGQFTYNLNRWAGLALDASGHYQDGATFIR